MARVRLLFAVAIAAACSDASSTLVLPPEVLDGSFSSAIVLLQSSQALDSEVLEAELIAIPPTSALRFALEDSTNARFRLLAYRSAPADLELELGPLDRAPPGTGLPLPEPAASYVSPSLEAGALSWSPVPSINMSTLPWRRPGQVTGPDCEGVHTQAWLVPGLELVQPRAMLALDANRALVAGQWSLEGSDGPRETLLVLVSELDTNASFESLTTELPSQSYRDVIFLDERTVLAATNRGWVTRLDIETREAASQRILPSQARWKLSRGDDGTVVAFDAQDDPPDSTRKAQHLLVPETLEVSALDAPEVLRFVSVVRRDFMIAAGDRTLYRLEGSTWIAEHTVPAPVTELQRHQDRFVAIVGRSFLLERGPDGSWTQIPSELTSFDMANGTFLTSGRFVVGGAAGFLLQMHEGQWCSIPRALSRAVREVAPVDASTGLAVTYSETVGELVGITRFTFPP